MNADKQEYTDIEALDKDEGVYPLIHKINHRPTSTALNHSLNDSIEYSTYEPETPVAAVTATAAAPPQLRIVSSTGNAAVVQEAAFDPAPL